MTPTAPAHQAVAGSCSRRLLQFGLREGKMAVDDFPFSVSLPIDFRAIPAGSSLLRSVRLIEIVDDVVGQHRHVAVSLYVRADHIVTVNLDLACERNQQFGHGIVAIDALVLTWIEIR